MAEVSQTSSSALNPVAEPYIDIVVHGGEKSRDNVGFRGHLINREGIGPSTEQYYDPDFKEMFIQTFSGKVYRLELMSGDTPGPKNKGGYSIFEMRDGAEKKLFGSYHLSEIIKDRSWKVGAELKPRDLSGEYAEKFIVVFNRVGLAKDGDVIDETRTRYFAATSS